jgi:hypothetical protein
MPHVPLKLRLLEAVIRIVLPFLGILLLVAGLMGVVSFAAMPLAEAMRSRQWVPVPAHVEHIQVMPADLMRNRPLPQLQVEYRYRYEGTWYTGDRHDLHHGLDTEKAMDARLAKLEDGEPGTAWVNPKAPEQSMMDRSLHWPVVALALPAAVVAVLGGLLVFAGMVAWNDWRPAWRRTEGE